jgi:phage shock protein PspC (stress-responsive transcriptional regulator)
MNEVSRIHLARVSYDIDVAAKKELEKYLTAVKRSLGSEVDAMEDIEIRMTEILAERGVVKDGVITESDIKVVIEQLGEPKDFASDEPKRADSGAFGDIGKKKYYRDTDNAVFGGVIAGLAAYTGWDVTLLRVLAVVLAIVPSWGTLIIVYIVVWICAPEAKSVSEKLEMHGEPVNLGSIKESAKKFGEQAEAVSQEVTAKASEISDQVKVQAPKIGSTVGRVILMTFGIFGIVICSLILCGLMISGVWAIPILVSASGVTAAPLLMVTIGLFFGCAFMFVMTGMILSSMLIDGQPKKHRTGCLACVLVAAVLMVLGSAAGASWTTLAGREGVERVADAVRSKVKIDVHDNNGRVKVELEPFKVNIETSE